MRNTPKTAKRLKLRNERIKARYNELIKLYPHWKHGAIIETLEFEFFLSETTILKIINEPASVRGI